MIEPETLNTIGLGLDIIGVGLLYRFGLPARGEKGGPVVLALDMKDEESAKEYERAKVLSPLGIILLMVGFALQAISNYV